MSMDFESVKSQYMKFPDKSDFVPVGADNGDIKFYYADDAGLQKAIRYLSPLDASHELAAVGEKEYEYGGRANGTEKKNISRTY